MTLLDMPTSPQQPPAPPAQDVDARRLVEVIRREHGDAGEDRLVELFVDYLKEHDEILLVLARRLVHSALTAQRRAERVVTDRGREREQVRAIAKQIKIAVVLDMVTPLGKRLRFLTGREVAACGDAFARIAQHVPDDSFVGEVLIESTARRLLLGDGT